jgi:hypothetical protein
VRMARVPLPRAGRHSNNPRVSVRASPMGAAVSRSSTARARCRANVSSAEDH